ncbi:MAG TPA: Spo0E family sporulation regulatory protein-aspartic acid phosphatase [Clostridiaceae bacterium]|nr:Spo0E family sporulation regulatory protein-aspartic acid phosphatase [Clostridiaceae bacterium]
MNKQKTVEAILLKISVVQDELHKLLNKENICSEKVIGKSHALDNLIVQYYNYIKKTNDKIR